MKRKYYIVNLKFYKFSDSKITVKAKTPKQAILKTLKETNYKKEDLQKVESVEEIDIFECLKEKDYEK